MSKHTPGPWVPPFRTVSQCFTSQYARGWNDCREAIIKSDPAPRLLEALEALLARDERNTCQHDETHRGGAIWEICNSCGMQWSDERDPKPEWKDPKEWIEARAAIAAATEGDSHE